MFSRGGCISGAGHLFLLPWDWFINHLEMFCNQRANAFLRAVASTPVAEPKPGNWERAWGAASPCLPKPTIWEVHVLPLLPVGTGHVSGCPQTLLPQHLGVCPPTVPMRGDKEGLEAARLGSPAEPPG